MDFRKPIVLYVPWLPWFDAYTIVPFILIVKRCKGDDALLAHEMVHVEQFWRRPISHGFLWLFSKEYRMEIEVEAYRASVRYRPDRLDRFALILATKYGFDLTFDQAKARLSEGAA